MIPIHQEPTLKVMTKEQCCQYIRNQYYQRNCTIKLSLITKRANSNIIFCFYICSAKSTIGSFPMFFTFTNITSLSILDNSRASYSFKNFERFRPTTQIAAFLCKRPLFAVKISLNTYSVAGFFARLCTCFSCNSSDI